MLIFQFLCGGANGTLHIMQLKFTKMHGLGNDFVMLDGIRQTLSLTPENIRKIADRRRGIGCDQVLVVEPAHTQGVDFGYRIFNRDGGEVEQCGNGARCFVRFGSRSPGEVGRRPRGAGGDRYYSSRWRPLPASSTRGSRPMARSR